jgi:hypothetical protein
MTLILQARTAAAPGGRLRLHLQDLPDLPERSDRARRRPRGIFVTQQRSVVYKLAPTPPLAHNGKSRHFRLRLDLAEAS